MITRAPIRVKGGGRLRADKPTIPHQTTHEGAILVTAVLRPRP